MFVLELHSSYRVQFYSLYAKFDKDLLKNQTFMAIKTSIPTCFFQHGRHLHFGEIKIKFSTLALTSLLLCILFSLRK